MDQATLRKKALDDLMVAVQRSETEKNYWQTCGRIWMAAELGCITYEEACDMVEGACAHFKLHCPDSADSETFFRKEN